MHGRVSAEITKDGLLLHATSELDLELAIENLRRAGRQILVGKPQINYIQGENWHEPFASLIVKLPTECTEVVRSDLLQRRAEVQHLESSRDGATTIRAFAPMSEIFGYAASLRTLTGGRGSFEQEFVDYRPFPSR
jgi:predicted membrane GTPase involved in stress response